jgi:hypothetical protein
MATIMPSNVEQTSGKEEELHQLNLKLDDLFERYLNLLDQYQAARLELSTQLSSVCFSFIQLRIRTWSWLQKGFFSLAQANFATNSRVRYGKDYYDERMQATRRVYVNSSFVAVGFHFNRFQNNRGNERGLWAVQRLISHQPL